MGLESRFWDRKKKNLPGRKLATDIFGFTLITCFLFTLYLFLVSVKNADRR